MAQIFSRRANWLARLSIAATIALVAAVMGVLLNLNRLDYVSQVGAPREQPVPFSHKHHVTGMGIDCRYCHTSVEDAAFAGLPPTETCMTCHSMVWQDAPILEPVRASLRDDRPLAWTRVHDLPDFVYFRHDIHVSRGVGCQTCHGQVDQMPLVWKAQTLNMEWCLGCHRHPEKYVRPRDQVYNMQWRAPANQEEVGRQLVEASGIRTTQLTNCSVCHL
ncbi:MAG: cytochrome c3 family protein [Gemmatimonadota bacterium]